MNPTQSRGVSHVSSISRETHPAIPIVKTARTRFLSITRPITALAIGALLAIASTCSAQTYATLTDVGGQPDVGENDISQLNTGSGSPDDLNYYFDNSTPPGQTFTTGSNASGYQLNSLSILTAGNSGNLPEAGQAYYLRIYSMSDTNATLLSTYISTNTFIFLDYDWLQWTDLNTILSPNAHYAYSFARASAGWENLANISGNPYADGEVALIPVNGGGITLGSSHDYDATFIAGLNPITSLVIGSPIISPSISVTVGATATISVVAAGPGTLTYQWQTDDGNGGSLTNIPSATANTLSVDTTGFIPGAYRYDVIVANGSTTITSSVVTLSVTPPVASATLTDIGVSASPLANDITQMVGGGTRDDLNYYTDNGPNNDNWAGQTFTTGTNTQGYYFTTLAILTGGGGSSGVSTAQTYELFIYKVEDDSALLMAHYTNAGFSFVDGDWLQWSGFNLTLSPNTTYAYAFGHSSTGTGWEALSVSPSITDLYEGGQICLIPAEGGTLTYGSTGLSDAVFDIGVLPIGVGSDPKPYAGSITVSPGRNISAGTQITLTQAATGNSPLYFQWQTDGGTGSTLTNIPSATGTNLVVNTTGWLPGTYTFDFVVTNVYGTSKSSTTTISVLYDQGTAILSDIGTIAPVPGSDDIYQLTTGSGSPDSLNYYYDNSSPPGQTFTTTKSSVLTTLAIRLAGSAGSVPSDGQGYILRLYKVSSGNAALYATYASATNFTYTSSDWLRWSGLSVPLSANTTYAYTFGRVSTGSGWENLANVTGDLYSGGEVVLIPTGGGSIITGSSHSYDATFDVGLITAGHPIISPLVFTPGQTIYAGTPVTVTADVTGNGPFTYQWMTDGGSGTLTNIPGATNSTLTQNTTTFAGSTVIFALQAVNASGSTTAKGAVVVNDASSPIITTDLPSNLSKFAGSTLTLSTAFDGSAPITYQWVIFKSALPENIPGQTNATLTIENLSTNDVGTYQVIASNSQGEVSSSTCTVSVWQPLTTPFNVNFQWYSTEGDNDVGNYVGTGITGFGTGTVWNSVVGPSSWSPGTYSSTAGYLDDGSVDTGISWTLVTGGSWDWTNAPTIALLDSSASSYGTQTFTFSLPNGLYNLVLFSCNGTEAATTNGGSVFTINGQTQTALPSQDTQFVLNDTYVVFSGLQVTDQTLTGTWSPATGKSYGSLNGAQLHYVSPITTVSLSIKSVSKGQIQLQWPQGTLQQATNVTGPWTATQLKSPCTITVNETQMFYRIKDE